MDVGLTCAVHVVSGQFKQPHVLVGDGIKRATGQQDQWHTGGGHVRLLLHTMIKWPGSKGESHKHWGSQTVTHKKHRS